MRLLTCIFLLVFFAACAATGGTKNTTNKPGILNGEWQPVKQEMGGTMLPTAAFENQKLIIGDSNYTFIAESIDKGTVKYSNDKMDIYGKEGVNAGKHFTAIYKYENKLLTICYNLAANSYPEAFETKGKKGLFLSVFKRIK